MSSIVTREDWIVALPADARDAVTAAMRLVHVPRGDHVTEAGRPATAIHRLRSGLVRLTGAYPDGREALITLYAPGAVFSETALVAGRPYAHTKTAVIDCEVEVLDHDAFAMLHARFPAIPEALSRKFARVIARQLETREAQDTRSLGERVARVFADLADAVGAQDGAGVRIEAPLSQAELGAHLGVTRQSIQKEVTELKRRGLLAKREGHWLVDAAGLKRDLGRRDEFDL